MNLTDVMTSASNRIEKGDKFGWSCWGDKSWLVSFVDVAENSFCTCVYDIETLLVYEVSIEVPGQPQAFRYINPQYIKQYLDEAKYKNIDVSIAWDTVKFTELTDENVTLAFIKDISQLYYDDLPVPEDPEESKKLSFREWVINLYHENFTEREFFHELPYNPKEYFEKYKYWLKREFKHQKNKR